MRFLIILLLSFSTSTLASSSSLRGNLLIEMMLAMMDSMGIIDRNDSNQTYPSFEQFQNRSLLSPDVPPFQSHTIIPYLPNASQASKPHWIEGRWLSRDGMILEVYNGQFKMYFRQAPKEVRSGLIRLKDQWLAIYEKTTQMTRQYEFAHKDGKLALRDNKGRLMLFKRLTDWPIPLN